MSVVRNVNKSSYSQENLDHYSMEEGHKTSCILLFNRVISRVGKRGIKLQTHYIRVNKLAVQEKLARDATFQHKTVLLIKMNGWQVIDAHTQIDLANRA